MKELTRIPNTRNAIMYRNILLKALDKADIDFEGEVKIHHEAQYSEWVVEVPDKQYTKAKKVMQKVISKGPPE